MRKAQALSTIFTSLALLAAGVAGAQEAPPGCYTRSYDAAHLAANPGQVVRRLSLHVVREEFATRFVLIARLAAQGHAGAAGFGDLVMTEGGSCYDDGHCWVDCDGGGFVITAITDAYIEITTDYMRIAHGDSCDGESRLSDLSEGPGQTTTYRLMRSRDALCGG